MDTDYTNMRDQGNKNRDSGPAPSSKLSASNRHQDNKYPPEEDFNDRDEQA